MFPLKRGTWSLDPFFMRLLGLRNFRLRQMLRLFLLLHQLSNFSLRIDILVSKRTYPVINSRDIPQRFLLNRVKELVSNVHFVYGGLGDFFTNVVNLQSYEVHVVLQIMKLEEFGEQHCIELAASTLVKCLYFYYPIQ